MRTIVIVALAAGALAAAGCGGSSKKSSSTTTTSTTRGYPGGSISIANYKTTLKQIIAQIQGIATNPPASTASTAEQVRFVQSLVSAVQQGHDQLAALSPAGPLGAANRAIVDAFTRYGSLLKQLATAAGKKDTAAEQRIDTAVKAENAALKAAVQQALGTGG